MSARALGGNLLGEVEECNLHEVFQSLRALEEPQPSPKLGVPAIDRIVGVVQNALRIKQSAKDSTSARKHVTKCPVIEITSACPGAGKSHLLYYITAVAILPEKQDGVVLGGKRGAVVILDTDGRFDVARLVQIAEQYIKQKARVNSDKSSELNEETCRNIVHAALQHVHVFRPQSLQSLIDSVSTLSSYLLGTEAHYSFNRPLVAVLLDSASAFYWQAKADEENGRFQEDECNGSAASIAIDNYANLVHHLRKVQMTFECPVIATTWGLTLAASNHVSNKAMPLLRPHLPTAWTSSITLHLTVERDAVAKFAPRMSLEEVARDKGARHDAVQNGSFSASVDAWGIEDWSDSARDALRGDVYRAFAFVISSEGIGFLTHPEARHNQ